MMCCKTIGLMDLGLKQCMDIVCVWTCYVGDSRYTDLFFIMVWNRKLLEVGKHFILMLEGGKYGVLLLCADCICH